MKNFYNNYLQSSTLKWQLPFLLLFFVMSYVVQAQSTDFMPMVYVEGGTFKMGGNSDEVKDNEKPVHTVTLSGYWIGQYEVTLAQYFTYCKETSIEKPGTPMGWGLSKSKPIVVSWQEAKAFASWLSEKTGKHYDLPTEAQWEYAARGGNRSQGYNYAGSNVVPSVAWFKDNSGPYRGDSGQNGDGQVVGKKKPNELNIYDMSGNVSEWCRDWYGPYESSEVTDPKGPGSGEFRVVRGGSYSRSIEALRITFRMRREPNVDNNTGYKYYKTDDTLVNGYEVGFRLICQ